MDAKVAQPRQGRQIDVHDAQLAQGCEAPGIAVGRAAGAGAGPQPVQLSPDIGGAAADEFLVERDGSHVRIIACAPSLTTRRAGVTPVNELARAALTLDPEDLRMLVALVRRLAKAKKGQP